MSDGTANAAPKRAFILILQANGNKSNQKNLSPTRTHGKLGVLSAIYRTASQPTCIFIQNFRQHSFECLLDAIDAFLRQFHSICTRSPARFGMAQPKKENDMNSTISTFVEKTGLNLSDIFVKADSGLVAIDKFGDLPEVVDFYTADGKHLGFVDGTYFELKSKTSTN